MPSDKWMGLHCQRSAPSAGRIKTASLALRVSIGVIERDAGLPKSRLKGGTSPLVGITIYQPPLRHGEQRKRSILHLYLRKTKRPPRSDSGWAFCVQPGHYSVLSSSSGAILSPASSTASWRAATALANQGGIGAPNAPAFSMMEPSSVMMYHTRISGQTSTV